MWKLLFEIRKLRVVTLWCYAHAEKNKHTTKFYVVDYQIDPYAERI